MRERNSMEVTQHKKLSFVIPVFRTEAYLKKCIESLLINDYKNIEIVVVADGESKEAEAIVKKLMKKDARIVKYLTIEHGGAPRARNAGYDYTTGDFVSFWDSDCYAEPGMVRVWVQTFEDEKVDFVYSGYRFSNDQNSFLNSEPFNPYLLTCNNYIATMFPMKREIFPGFDENLKSLQDWDLWLTLTEKGKKGYYNEGSAFTTELREGISSKGCHPDEWLNRYEAVRKKHGITGRDICFTSANSAYKHTGIELAEMFNQDYSDSPSFHPHRYKFIYLVGFFAKNAQQGSLAFKGAKDCKKIIHWIGADIESVHMMPYYMMKMLVEGLKTIDKHYAINEKCRKMLEEIGIKSEVLQLPMKVKDVECPKEFKVYYEYDSKESIELINSVKASNPDIKFESENAGMLKDYACFLSVTSSQFPSENMKRFILAGRHIITNYQDIYSNYTELDKEKITRKLREYRKQWTGVEVNKEAKDYYLELINPENYISKVRSI